MHFFSFFKTLTGKKVQVELKNDIILQGYLHTVDQYMNLKLRDMTVTEPDKYPHLASVSNIFIRGSAVRYVHLNPDDVDTTLLQDACRRAYPATK